MFTYVLYPTKCRNLALITLSKPMDDGPGEEEEIIPLEEEKFPLDKGRGEAETWLPPNLCLRRFDPQRNDAGSCPTR